MALPYALFARGVQTVSAREASLLVLIEPLLNPLWVWLVWSETVSDSTWIGGGCILSGLILRTLLTVRRRHRDGGDGATATSTFPPPAVAVPTVHPADP